MLVRSTSRRSKQKDAPLYQNERPHGGARGTRTPDPLLAKQMRYQLRYSPEKPNILGNARVKNLIPQLWA